MSRLSGIARRWAKLDAILDGVHPLSRSANIHGMMIDVVSRYLLYGTREELDLALRELTRRHPNQKRLATKMRAYAKAWYARRA